ncbi:C-type lectin-like [Mugil cephalus]|uniref:C-type lectin-like n=1 Tax=Mugil cephalus TaxID=48193 RepID=UPI001FB5D656|nr:C-type lectin-like [Mugil cephalus]
MILFLFLFGLVLGELPPSDIQEVPLVRGSCPLFWFSFNGDCYKYISTRLTWADAEIQCMSEGAHLVSIHSAEEQNFVKTLIMNFDPAIGYTWIGLNDIYKEGTWMWSDGSAVNFTFWKAGEPNNSLGKENCVQTWTSDTTWNDYTCQSMFSFICASRTVC